MLLAVVLALAAAPDLGAVPPVAPLSLAPVAAGAPQAAAQQAAPVPAPVLVGGYAPISPRAPQLRPVLAAALPSLTPARHARVLIVRAEQQVVAGMNYRLLVKLRDGSRWRVVVWQRLDGGYEVTEAVRTS